MSARLIKVAAFYLVLGVTMGIVMAGVAMHRYKLTVLPVLVLTPIAIPEILMGVSLLIFFVLLNFTLGLVSVALAHIAFCIGFVAIVVRARLAGMSGTASGASCGGESSIASAALTASRRTASAIPGAPLPQTVRQNLLVGPSKSQCDAPRIRSVRA